MLNTRDYELIQIPKVIYSSTGVEFGEPLVPLPTLSLGIKTSTETVEMHKKVEEGSDNQTLFTKNSSPANTNF